mmetsp:Transcript_1099/g.2368  ORF Transcript_1099/g.2368 Transcript_1099/m.2368 type:complete len:114 (-) Transcript_1099:1793-2134(-)
MDAHPRTRPDDGSFIFVGGFDIARLEHEVGEPTKLLYFREEAGQVWDAVENLKLNPIQVAGLNVAGSPGVGKSCEVWAWISCNIHNIAQIRSKSTRLLLSGFVCFLDHYRREL